jgi:hypothetical protein
MWQIRCKFSESNASGSIGFSSANATATWFPTDLVTVPAEAEDGSHR